MTNNSLVQLMRIKIILEEIEKNYHPTISQLQTVAMNWLLDMSLIFDDIKTDISERSITRDIKELREVFDINIEYDKKAKGYYINSMHPQKEDAKDALETIHLYFIKKNFPDAKSYIRFAPRKAKGRELFFVILKAIKDRKKVSFIYEQYEKHEQTERNVSPLGLKEFKGFWYLIAKDDEGIKSFGLDRVSGLNIRLEKFAYAEDFDIDEYYKYCFGIVRYPNDEPQEIIIKTTPIKASYYIANPLHPSQKIIEA